MRQAPVMAVQSTVLAVRLLASGAVHAARTIGQVGAAEDEPRSAPPSTPTIRRRSIPGSLRWAALQRDNHSCRYCGSTFNLTVDRIHPVSHDDGDRLANLQTLCRVCACSKGAKVLS